MSQHKLIITEKPSVAQDYAKVLHVSGTHNGYIENDEWIITWCVGHLVEMSYPEKYDPELKKWSLDTLPFLPENYKYEIKPDTKDQFKVIKELVNRKDVTAIYNAGDSGREGEYIQRLVLMMAGHNPNAKLLRIWIDSQTEEEIKKGIRTAKDSSYYDSLAESSYMRAIEDYAVGINLSRALSCKFGYEMKVRLNTPKIKPIPVGRVMTCVLGMVVERERAIRNFVPTKFYKIKADTGFISGWKAVESSHYYNSPLLYNDSGFKEKKDADSLLNALQKDNRLRVESVEKKQQKKKAPKLFNLAELQAECSKKFKISPDETLEIAQKLYESKMTTYPRTDARVISTAVAKVIDNNIEGLLQYPYRSTEVQYILDNDRYKGLEKTEYCDDTQITDHYAIIPTGEYDKASELSDIELKVFHLILDRFLSIFYPPAVYEKMEVILLHPTGEKFFVSEKVLKEKGYLEITGATGDNTTNPKLSNVKKGEILNAKFSEEEGQTTPPKRYDSGSIVLAMENAGNLIEDEELRAQIKGCGIGTSATRAAIIKKLVGIEHISIDKKTQIVKPTETGEYIYDLVAKVMPALLNPKMTASWEKGLEQIRDKSITPEKYKKTLYDFIIKNVNNIKQMEAETESTENLGIIVGVCPFCGGDIVTTRFGIGCADYKKNNCKFVLSTAVVEKMGNEQLAKLMDEGETDLIEGLTSKTGKKFAASFKINHEEKKIDMVLPGSVFEKVPTNLKCMKSSCRKKGLTMMRAGSMLSCPCGFKMYTTLCGKELDDDELMQLLDGNTIMVDGLKSKSGNKFSCNVRLKRTGKIDLIFK